MGEWFNPVAWNAAVGQLTGGSNPPLPAIVSQTPILSTLKMSFTHCAQIVSKTMLQDLKIWFFVCLLSVFLFTCKDKS